MHLFVIGESGQIAQSFKALSNSECKITTVGRPSCDITDLDCLKKTVLKLQPNILINASAYTAVDNAETNKTDAFAVNCLGAKNAALVAAEFQIPLIHFSTDYVFDGTDVQPYVANATVSPLNVYGQSKAEGESEIRRLLPEHIILRTAWVFSQYGQNFVKTMLRLGKQRDTLSVVNDQFGNPTYAMDVARATVEIAHHLKSERRAAEIWGTYHLVNSGSTSRFEFANEIFKLSTPLMSIDCDVKPISSAEFPTPAKRPLHSELDSSKLDKVFDIKLRSWKEALRDCILALRDEYS